MTTSDQKKRERSILNQYLPSVGLDGGIVVEQERPDFVITKCGRKVGVEITEYHQSNYSCQSYSRTQVEAEWYKFRSDVIEYREAHEGLEGLSVLLTFAELKVPNGNDRSDFIEAVHKEIERLKPDISDQFTQIRVNEKSPAILQRYLTKIDVRLVGCYMEWDWNHMVASVGTSDEELFNILYTKLALTRDEEIDELHLVLAGDGPTGGSYIGYLSPNILAGWGQLNAALDRSDYDLVIILNYGESCVWRRMQGWTLAN